MLTIITFSVFVVLSFAANQMTNFDYLKHGDDWDSCPKNGSKQSPILLHLSEKVQKQKDTYLFGDYSATKGIANFLNTTIYINTSDSFGAVSTKLIDGVSLPFKATQMRIRMHSQHQTEEGFYDMQLQIFHTELYQTSRNYKFAIGLFFQVAEKEDPFVKEIIDKYDKTKPYAEINIDLRYLISKNVIEDYWFYSGSPTIPGCTDGKLHWVVLRKAHSMTADQKDKLQKILSQGKEDWPGNWRNIQNQNTNIVGLRQIQPLSEM